MIDPRMQPRTQLPDSGTSHPWGAVFFLLFAVSSFCDVQVDFASEAGALLAPESLQTDDTQFGSIKGREVLTHSFKVFSLPATHSSGSTARGLKETAEAYEAARKIPEAIMAYETYLRSRPRDHEARFRLGRLYGWNKQYERALEQFRLVLAANPNSLPAFIGTARVLSWQEKYEESLRLYDRGLSIEPRNAEAQSGKAFVLLWTGHFEEARKLFAQVHRRFPQDIEVSEGLRRAEAALAEKNVAQSQEEAERDQARSYYRERVARDPHDSEAVKSLTALDADRRPCPEIRGLRPPVFELSRDSITRELSLLHTIELCQQYAEALARYRRTHPSASGPEEALLQQGQSLLRAAKFQTAAEVFADLERTNPENLEAKVGLARALAGSGDYARALLRYDEVLRTSPNNYDALQGKAFVLYWTRQYEQARTLFQVLAAREPRDPQNAEALEKILKAEEEVRWMAMRPPPDAPPEALLRFHLKRLESFPGDKDALKGLGNAQARLRNYPAAIGAYRRALELGRDDTTTKMELARVLSLDGQYGASVQLYREILNSKTDDTDALEALASVYVRSGQPSEALPLIEKLCAREPSNMAYRLELARAQARLKRYAEARSSVTAVLSKDPQNRDARRELANLDLLEGQLETALNEFNRLVTEKPDDFEARLGLARALYYREDLGAAHRLARRLVAGRPDSFDALFLLASVERARHNPKNALTVLDQAEQLDPHNVELRSLQRTVRDESRVVLHTSASYAREIGSGSLAGNPASSLNEDLRNFGYETTLRFLAFPRSESHLSLYYLPSNSPSGGIQGAVAPGQFLYRQTIWLTPHLTLRGGAGVVRFGPGTLENLPGQTQPISSAHSSPIGFIGFRSGVNTSVSLDLAASRSAITYTPTSTRLGVVEDRLTTGLDLKFDRRTELRVEYFFAHYSSKRYGHVTSINSTTEVIETKSDRDQAHGGSLTFDCSLVRSERLSFGMGYSGLAYGFAGHRRGTFLGFFNPSFYQRHYLTTRFSGTVWRAISYVFSGGIGLQQVEQGTAVTRALLLSPALHFKAGSRLTLAIGYTHYNTAQSLGILRGNAVRFSTDWEF